jgi:hypothetical protein
MNKIHSVIFGFVWLSEKNQREKKRLVILVRSQKKRGKL